MDNNIKKDDLTSPFAIALSKADDKYFAKAPKGIRVGLKDDELGKANRIRNFRKAVKWFKNDLMKALKGQGKGQLKTVSKFQIGKFYTYGYQAKHKDTLPYYDKFPIILLINAYSKNGNRYLVGLNFHYLPPAERVKLIEKLMKFSSAKNITPRSRLRMTYDSIKNIPGVDYTIHQYIFDGKYFLSQPLNIPLDIAKNAIMLPTQHFLSKGRKMGAKKVWSRS